MNNPPSPKERGLLKGAIRRLFSRSDLRRKVAASYHIKHHDPMRPRVTKWSWCPLCGVIYPAYQSEVDHINPVIPLDKSLDDLTWDELVDRVWCAEVNLQAVCKECHKEKTKIERKQRRRK